MVGTFTTELIDGKPDAEKSAPAIHLLCSALRQTLHEMDDQALTYQRVKSRVSARIRSVKSIMEIPRTLIVDWTEDVRYRSFTPATSALVDTVSSSISGASTAIAELDSLVALSTTPARCVALWSTLMPRPMRIRRHCSVLL